MNLEIIKFKTCFPKGIYTTKFGLNFPTSILQLRGEHKLRVFDNKEVRKIFWANRDEIIGEWRKLHDTELQALYSSPTIISNLKSTRLRWAGHVARMEQSSIAHRVLGENLRERDF